MEYTKQYVSVCEYVLNLTYFDLDNPYSFFLVYRYYFSIILGIFRITLTPKCYEDIWQNGGKFKYATTQRIRKCNNQLSQSIWWHQ